MLALFHDRFGFFSCLALGCLFLFGTSSAVNICIMSSVPPKSRPIALGISNVLMHAMGDVPSPTVIVRLTAHDLIVACYHCGAETGCCG
jgi:hypothetical protein